MRYNIVLVGSDPQTCEHIMSALREVNCDCMQMLTVERELDRLVAFKPDLVILDLETPGTAGLFYLDLIRVEPRIMNTLVFVLAANKEFSCLKEAFERGADGFMYKPFDRKELAYRIRALLRIIDRIRFSPIPSSADARLLTLKKDRRQAYIDNIPLNLTRMEFEILSLLKKDPGRVLTRDYMLKHLWGSAEGLKTRALDMHISNLRRKLGVLSACIETVPGQGYRLICSDGENF
ncbi:MAG: response regulator transcription factor [Elusimicrobiaceae bacterium]|jgi:DNA-binding response OmpR family regulator